MKNLVLASFFSISTISFSQITVVEADFPLPDDTVMISTSIDLSIDFASTGADYTWDFSDLEINSQEIDTFHDVSDASVLVQAAFNNWITASAYDSEYYNEFEGLSFGSIPGLSFNNTNEYTKYTGSEIQITGWSLDINDVEVPIQANEIDNQYELPLDYGNTWTSTFFIDLDMNPAFDAIYRRHQDRSAEVDGWGTITTPFGTFDCIRIKTDLSYDDSIKVGIFPWTAIPTPDRHEYTWWTNGQKIPILKIVTTGAGTEVVTSIQFKDKDRNLSSINESTLNSVNIYPNPANDQFTIENTEGAESIVITNVLGQTVFSIDNPSQLVNIDASNWESGMYIVSVNSAQGTRTERLVIK